MYPFPSLQNAGGVLFTPVMLSSCVAMYQDPNLFATVSNGVVTSWGGVVGPTLTPFTTGPAYSATGWEGAQPACVFTGATTGLRGTLGAAIGGTATIFSVYKITTAGLACPARIDATTLNFDTFTSHGYCFVTWGGGLAYSNDLTASAPVLHWGWNDGANNQGARLRGAVLSAFVAAGQTVSLSSSIALASSAGGSATGLDGPMACTGFFNHALAPAERAKVEGWAGWKYTNVTLPSGHAYKTTPPFASAEEIERVLDLGLYERRASGLIAPRRPNLQPRLYVGGFKLAA